MVSWPYHCSTLRSFFSLALIAFVVVNAPASLPLISILFTLNTACVVLTLGITSPLRKTPVFKPFTLVKIILTAKPR